jgi:Galactose oxidase, central domain
MAPLNGTVVLFGGQGDDDNRLADTWTWDGMEWMQHGAAGPSGRWGAVMAAVAGVIRTVGA